MDHVDLVLEAMRYFRHVGADRGSIRTYVGVREPQRQASAQDLEALARLEADGEVIRVGKKWLLSAEAYRNARGPALAPKWETGDAWVFLAILLGRGAESGRLDQIVAVADFINHAIPSLEEMHGALNRLHEASLIDARDDTFPATDEGRVLYSKVESGCPKYVLDQLAGLRAILECPCCGVRLKAVRWRISLDDRQYRDAIASYLQKAR